MVKKLIRGLRKPGNWLAAVPIAFFFGIVAFNVIPPNAIAIITNGLDIGGAILINFAFLPVWVKLLRRPHSSPEAFLFGGMLLMVNAVAASRVWSWALILADKPAWMINHWFQSFCYLMVGLGMFYLLKIPGEKGKSSVKYIAWGLVLAVAVMVLFLLHWE